MEGAPSPEVGLTLRSTPPQAYEELDDTEDKATPLDIEGAEEEEEDDYKETIIFPESTHTLLFTEPCCSIPTLFSLLISWSSFMSLSLAYTNNLKGATPDNVLNVPSNVTMDVRCAQYLAIFIAMLMEEEIPTGLYLLRMIPNDMLKAKFPQIKYWEFVLSNVTRISLGYYLLFNAFLVVVQADRVLDIFFDVLALQFLQQLDDIAFSLCKMDVLGKSLKRAATKKYFRTEFHKRQFSRFRGMSCFLKAIYFVNLALGLAGLTLISSFQMSGKYQSDSVIVTFGDEIWDEAIINTTSPDELEKRMLMYSYFNGVYSKSGTNFGRPVYVEQNKFHSTPTPFQEKIGAEIKYCEELRSWVFMHPNIRKSEEVKEDCPWLLKSPETDGHDLLDVVSDEWSIWIGTIVKDAKLSIVPYGCSLDSDCNYNGECSSSGECVCFDKYSGSHCELKKPCRNLKGDGNDTWTAVDWSGVYGRPVYNYRNGSSDPYLETYFIEILYSGSRWITVSLSRDYVESLSADAWKKMTMEYHAFWDSAFTNKTIFVSGPSSDSSPIKVDFYLIGEKDKRYGPMGLLYPTSDVPGRGYFDCMDSDWW